MIFRLFRYFTVLVLLLVVLLLVPILTISFTDGGTAFVWNKAKDFVPGLKGEIISGSLSSGIHLKDFSFDIDGFSVDIKDFDSKWDLMTLIYGRFDINSLNVAGINLKIDIPQEGSDPLFDEYYLGKAALLWTDQDPTQADDKMMKGVLDKIANDNEIHNKDKGNPFYIDIPLDINLKSSEITNFSLVTDIFKVSAEKLNASARLHKHNLTNADVVGDTVVFELLDLNFPVYPTFPSPKILNGFDREEFTAKSSTLPTVFIPFDIEIKRLQLKNSRYFQSSYDTESMDAILRGHIRDYNIDITESNFDSSQYGKININGHIGLKDYLDLDLKSTGTLDYTPVDDLRFNFPFNLTVKGDLSDMNVEMNTEDQRKLYVKSHINVLDGILTNSSSISYDKLEWPLNSSEPEHLLSAGHIKYDGSLKNLDLKFDSGVKTSAITKKVQVSTEVSGTFSDILIKELNLSSGKEDRLAATAHIMMDDSRIKVENLELSLLGAMSNYLSAGLADHIVGQLKASADYSVEEGDLALDIPKLDFKGRVINYPFSINANLDGLIPTQKLASLNFDDLNLKVDLLNLDVAGNTINSKGVISGKGENSFVADIRLVKPEELTKVMPEYPISGTFNAAFSLDGKLTKPHITLNGGTDKLKVGEILELAETVLKIDERVDLSTMKFDGLALIKFQNLIASGNMIKNLILKLEGNQDAHNFTFWIRKDDELAFAFKEMGSLKGLDSYHADFNAIEITTPIGVWRQKQPLALDYNILKNIINFSAFNLVNNEQSIVFEKGFYSINDGASDVHIALKRFSSMFINKYMPQDTMLLTNFNGKIIVEAKPHSNMIVNANIHSINGMFQGISQTSTYRRFDVDVKLDEKQQLTAGITLDADEYGKLSVNSQYNLKEKDAVLGRGSEIVFDKFDIGLFNPLVNSLDTLKAVIDGKGTVDVDKPSGNMFVVGDFNVTDGNVVTESDIIALDDFKFKIHLDHDNVKLDGGFKLGEGQGKILGDIDIRPLYQNGIPKGKIGLDMDRAEISLAGLGSAEIDSHFDLLFRQSNREGVDLETYLKGVVKIPKATIEVLDVGDSGDALSSDVEIITKEKAKDDKGLDKKKLMEKSPENFFFDINVSVGPEVSVNAYGLTTGLDGKLLISNTTTKEHTLDSRGKISLNDGRFRSFGQNLIIRKGEILFDGIISNPSIKFEAIRDPETIIDNSGTIAGLRVFGTPLKMDLKVFSEPEMSDAEKLSYLLKGTPLAEDSNSNSAAAASMLLGASLGNASNSLRGITNALGLQDFQLESAGSGNSSAVQASFYLTRKLKVSYGYGIFDSIGQLKLRYEIMKKLYLQFVNSTDQTLDLFYSFSFD